MLYFIISFSIILVFIILWLFTNSIRNKKNKIKNIEINFDDVDSLNVSKIVIDDNDLDFVRNEFWFQFKQKGILNVINFNKLKRHFEAENNIKISQITPSPEIKKLENKDLVDLIISDLNEKNYISQAFKEIEDRLNSN